MKLLDVKLGQLPTWLAMRDFTPSGIGGALRRGEGAAGGEAAAGPPALRTQLRTPSAGEDLEGATPFSRRSQADRDIGIPGCLARMPAAAGGTGRCRGASGRFWLSQTGAAL